MKGPPEQMGELFLCLVGYQTKGAANKPSFVQLVPAPRSPHISSNIQPRLISDVCQPFDLMMRCSHRSYYSSARGFMNVRIRFPENISASFNPV